MGKFVDEEVPVKQASIPIVIADTPKKKSKPRTPKVNKEPLIYELKILIACSRSGHKKYLQYSEYKIKTAEQLNIRINDLISLISK